jgi:hypothetical protein
MKRDLSWVKLEELANDKDCWPIRDHVARRTDSPIHILEQLSNDDNVGVVFSVYCNSNCPPKLKSAIKSYSFLYLLANP